MFRRLANKPIQVIESKAYYEAVSHVLKCLKDQPDTTQEGQEIPLQRLIVDVNQEANHSPKFILEPDFKDYHGAMHQYIDPDYM